MASAAPLGMVTTCSAHTPGTEGLANPAHSGRGGLWTWTSHSTSWQSPSTRAATAAPVSCPWPMSHACSLGAHRGSVDRRHPALPLISACMPGRVAHAFGSYLTRCLAPALHAARLRDFEIHVTNVKPWDGDGDTSVAAGALTGATLCTYKAGIHVCACLQRERDVSMLNVAQLPRCAMQDGCAGGGFETYMCQGGPKYGRYVTVQVRRQFCLQRLGAWELWVKQTADRHANRRHAQLTPLHALPMQIVNDEPTSVLAMCEVEVRRGGLCIASIQGTRMLAVLVGGHNTPSLLWGVVAAPSRSGARRLVPCLWALRAGQGER